MTYDDHDNYANDVADLRAKVAAEQRATYMRLHHWCADCRGFTGPGSPCYYEPEDEAAEESDA